VLEIEEKLVSSHGVHRYPDDRYKGAPDGDHEHKNEQAGAWPILTFWLSIAMSKLGKKDKARKYFDLVVDLVDEDGMIPEQFFCCERAPWLGVKPLVWSQAMFVLAAKELGYYN
jgi:GH15 family glucan-1,4-alpha-glucosidase